MSSPSPLSVPAAAALASWLSAMLLAVSVLGRAPEDALPQIARGGDALSVAFGGAKQAISAAALTKADSYFHGGIDMECTDEEYGGHQHHHDHEGDVCEEHGEGCDGHHHHDQEGEEGSEEAANGEAPSRRFDPWAWINVRVRAPEIEKHLEGKKAVELIPWLWASVHADPHNVEAWTTALYIASSVMGDRDLGERIIEDGVKANPGSFVIERSRGQFYYNVGKGDFPRARAAFEAGYRKAQAACDGDFSKLSEDDARVFAAIVSHLGIFAKDENDADLLRRYLSDLESLAVPTPATEHLKRLLKELEP